MIQWERFFMDGEFLVFGLFFLLFCSIILFFLRRWLLQLVATKQSSNELLDVIQLLQSGSKEDRKVLLETLQSNTHHLNQRLDQAAQVIGQLQKHIGEMNEIGRSMKDLQEYMNNPKLRGNISEQILRDLLNQFLPKQSFHLQYTFKSGVIVDAAIQTANGMIPVDAKFPMEQFRLMMSASGEQERATHQKAFLKSVREHINDISRKYILPSEGTIDYALMYIPTEAVYYEIVNAPDLFDYASKKRVLPVSPLTMYAYVKAILMSFEGQKIEQSAREIVRMLRTLHHDYQNVSHNLGILGRHLTNAQAQMMQVTQGFTQLGQKITSASALSSQSQSILDHADQNKLPTP